MHSPVEKTAADSEKEEAITRGLSTLRIRRHRTRIASAAQMQGIEDQISVDVARSSRSQYTEYSRGGQDGVGALETARVRKLYEAGH